MQQFAQGKSQAPCLFIFGDSQSDNGNNNLLPTLAKCNYQPYGIHFPKGPTGRCTNGQTPIDYISKLLGFENFIPPFANPNGSNILKGVNYASGTAGIRPETGKHIGVNIHLGAQLINHRVIYSKIVEKLGGSRKAEKYLNKCLYYVNIGNNDYIANYFLPQFYLTSRAYTPQQYAKTLIHQYSQYIQELHDDFGARKFVLVGVADIGCTPNAIFTHKTNGSNCFEYMNDAASMFNDELRSLVNQFNDNFADSKFIYTRSHDKTLFQGFNVTNAPCCQTVMNGLCVPNETPCQNTIEYGFWDGFHPSETANKIVAIRSYNTSNPSFTYPMNIKHLVASP